MKSFLHQFFAVVLRDLRVDVRGLLTSP